MTESQKHLLIIDDDPDLCKLLKTRFEQLGFVVMTANDGAEGFQKIVAQLPDGILLDVRIPRGQDGLTFLRSLRAFRHEDPDRQSSIRRIPVIVVTAAGDDMRPLFEMEGISDYVEKPFDSEDIKRRVLKSLPSSLPRR